MEISEADLKEPRESWAKEFGPDNARWVLLVALEDSGSHLTFGSSGDVIVLGTLFYKASGQMVWRGVAAGSGAPDKAIQDAVRDFAPGGGQGDLALRSHANQGIAFQALDGHGNCRRRDIDPSRKRGRFDTLAFGLRFGDGLEVVFLGDGNLHACFDFS